ncbi:acylneuraminate cytidylyltransferase [Myceligenerans indicum]|uniref:N-acylneuraminate cytidylyltransferase n=1 Tax=Myceligenerans indicum TaxID=2593663 RepID=A0ABS1LIJ7_9MICO|nr:acylneuraminate cytidylyltransferase [Myceligenerans indicum]MBL0885864.1 acylneuraminate cytidylyltransferase [Myceligenerans indicum]
MPEQAAPSAIVIIPARGGSQGVPLKNLARVDGITLVGRAVRAALAAPSVATVVVSTDHDEIAAEARSHGARVVVRPAEIAGGTASSESALTHVLERVEAGDGGLPPQEIPPVTVLLQCTSPFIDSEDLDTAIRRVTAGERDVVVAVAETHDFQWRLDDAVATPVGHTTDYRPRRQDRAPHFRETGAFYVMRTDGFREGGKRFFGDVGIQPVAPEWSIEIDEPSDLRLARQLVDQDVDTASEPIDVDALVTDFDGVHTDDHAYVDQDGTEQVRVSRGDGMGVSRLRRAGVPMLILSTETNKVVASRAQKLQVEVLHGIDDKATALRGWLAERGLDPARVAYVGNDVNDLPAMAVVGWPVAVADARGEVKAQARIVLSHSGGNGAVREICDRILAGRPGEVAAASTGAAHTTVVG